MADYKRVIHKIDNLVNKNKINAFSSCVFNKDDVLFSHSCGICEKNFKKDTSMLTLIAAWFTITKT